MSSRSIICMAVSLLFLGAGIALATQNQNPPSSPKGLKIESRPDLVVVSIEFKNYRVYPNPDGTKSGSVYPAFTYKNQGPTATGNFNVAWEYWDHASKAWIPFLGQFFTNHLGAGQSWTEGGQPVDTCTFTVGVNPPRFRVRLDTGNTVAESNENNNVFEKEFKPMIAGPIPPIKK
jgi:hypothetical protein